MELLPYLEGTSDDTSVNGLRTETDSVENTTGSVSYHDVDVSSGTFQIGDEGVVNDLKCGINAVKNRNYISPRRNQILTYVHSQEKSVMPTSTNTQNPTQLQCYKNL